MFKLSWSGRSGGLKILSSTMDNIRDILFHLFYNVIKLFKLYFSQSYHSQPDMKKGTDAQTLSVEFLMDYGYFMFAK